MAAKCWRLDQATQRKIEACPVKLDTGAPDGFIVNSFAKDNPIECKDYVRAKTGISPFKPNGKRQPVFDIDKAIAAQSAWQAETQRRCDLRLHRRERRTSLPSLQARTQRVSPAPPGWQGRLDSGTSIVFAVSPTAGQSC